MRHQLLMATLLRNAVFSQNHDCLRVPDSRQSVSNGQSSPAAGQQLKGLLNNMFTFIIQRRGCFIQNQYRRIFKENARY